MGERRERRGRRRLQKEVRHTWGTKREVNKSCRSVPSQWYHSDDATSNTGRERKSERGGTKKREKE